MKYLKYLLMTALIIAVSCSEDKTKDKPEDATLKTQRTALQKADATGIYRSGEAILLFDKTSQQLFADPSQRTFRILDDTGTKYVTLRLDAMPTSEGQTVIGRFTDNMGLNIGNIEDLVLLKSDSQYLRFWSDRTRVGFVFPRMDI